MSRARDKEVAVRFGHRLRALRSAASLSQETLAHTAGLHPTFISNVERGYSSPTLETILKLAGALAVEPGELINGLDRPDA